MKNVSINNGRDYMTADEAISEIMERNIWDALINVMDDETREAVAYDLAPCSELEFLREYLNRASSDLILG